MEHNGQENVIQWQVSENYVVKTLINKKYHPTEKTGCTVVSTCITTSTSNLATACNNVWCMYYVCAWIIWHWTTQRNVWLWCVQQSNTVVLEVVSNSCPSPHSDLSGWDKGGSCGSAHNCHIEGPRDMELPDWALKRWYYYSIIHIAIRKIKSNIFKVMYHKFSTIPPVEGIKCQYKNKELVFTTPKNTLYKPWSLYIEKCKFSYSGKSAQKLTSELELRLNMRLLKSIYKTGLHDEKLMCVGMVWSHTWYFKIHWNSKMLVQNVPLSLAASHTCIAIVDNVVTASSRTISEGDTFLCELQGRFCFVTVTKNVSSGVSSEDSAKKCTAEL